MINEFQNYLVSVKGYSQHTAMAYGKDARDFARYMRSQREDARWSTVQQADLDGFMGAMTKAGMKPSTINRHVSSVRALFKYMIREGMMTTNPVRYASMQKQEKSLPNTIPTEELVTATEHATGTLRVMLLILVVTGCRIQEMLDIEQCDINEEEQSIRIHGKGKKDRDVYATVEEIREIQEYAKGRPAKMFGGIEQRAARYAIYQHLSRYSKAKQLSPHAIRHTVATNMAKQGANVTCISKLLGHESIKTTQKYIDMSQQDVREACIKYSIIN